MLEPVGELVELPVIARIEASPHDELDKSMDGNKVLRGAN
jgi:hypothetical protein